MPTINYEGHSVEVDHLEVFDYADLFHWPSLKNCVFLEVGGLPKNVKTIVDFFKSTKAGYAFELEKGGAIFGFSAKDISVRGIRTENALYVLNGQEVVRYRESEVHHIAVMEGGGYRKTNALLRDAFLEAGSAAFHLRHYRYLDMVLPIFSKMVKFIEPTCILELGDIAAHGDKCYQYIRDWEKAGIPFNRGALLFLMTYTQAMDMEKHQSCEWVIKNYGRFKSILNVIEESIGITDYLEEIQHVEQTRPLHEGNDETQPS